MQANVLHPAVQQILFLSGCIGTVYLFSLRRITELSCGPHLQWTWRTMRSLLCFFLLCIWRQFANFTLSLLLNKTPQFSQIFSPQKSQLMWTSKYIRSFSYWAIGSRHYWSTTQERILPYTRGRGVRLLLIHNSPIWWHCWSTLR